MDMTMRKWCIKSVAVVVLSISASLPAVAENTLPDSVSTAVRDAEIERYQQKIQKYEERLAARERRWKRLIPNLFTLQYAGGIGMFSIGPGWDYGRSQQWETHLLVGIVPHRYDYPTYWTLTLRESYVPWRIRCNDQWSIRPLSVSLSVNSILHSEFWTSEPERYPDGYYGFSSRIRFHLGFGQRVTFTIPEHKRILGKEISLYYEISTCDLYVRQKILSSKVPLKDIIILGVGLIYTI